jgi:hypothetical protein
MLTEAAHQTQQFSFLKGVVLALMHIVTLANWSSLTANRCLAPVGWIWRIVVFRVHLSGHTVHLFQL